MPFDGILRQALAVAGLSLAVAGSALAQAATPNPAQAERPDDHVMGAEDAPLLIVEYASYACPHCAQFQQSAWPVVRSEFVETGQVRWIYRPMLTNPVQIAGAGMIMADCAAEERFFEVTDLLYAEQSAIFETAQSGGDVLGVYNRIGAAVGLTPEAFMACLRDPVMNEAVNQAAIQASEDGVGGTPSFIIDGHVLTIAHTAQGHAWVWNDEPLIINGERVPGELSGDSFRRIVLHFLNSSDSEN